ncbi:acyl CoA:acetate/3-ketoacid CoA transferase [candidate division KSB1 bacterium]|nr:acyl CoA:acetate/3-ketoacid CoA transferase [candidate division KSB1 bacterium]
MADLSVEKHERFDQAIDEIANGATICISGSGGGLLEPDAILQRLEQRFLDTGEPNKLTLVHAASIGDSKSRGLNRFVHPGMVKRIIGGHWGWAPRIGEMALNGDIQGYNFPQGAISLLFREIAAGRPGLFTRTGLHTFADPRIEGGRLSAKAPPDIVSVMTINNSEYLFYESFQIDYAFLLGSKADLDGNISFEKEPAYLDASAMAMAAHNSGGKVLVQVKEIVPKGSLDARLVIIPGIFVDHVLCNPDQWQTYEGEYNPAFSGEKRIPLNSLAPLPLDQRKVIARRAALELKPELVVNLGFGMPDGVAAVAAEEGVSDWLNFTVEQGPVGGVPAKGAIFGVSTNPLAILDMPSNFDFYQGGGLDLAVLSFAQVDASGNVNVSKFGGRLAGCGGFVDISQNAKKVVFVGTMTAGGLDVDVQDGRFKILKEGRNKKFLEQVEQITFSGFYSAKVGQRVLYVTERAVFELLDGKLVLTEIAPGINLEHDILQQMAFEPHISEPLKSMDIRLFKDTRMHIAP